MAESGKIREIDSVDSSDETAEFSDANDQISVRKALQVLRPSMPGTVQEFGKNILQSLVKHSEKHGTVVAPTFVFKQTINEGDNIETSIGGSSDFTLDRSSNTYEKTSTTKKKAAKSNDAVENETKGEIPFHFKDSIRVDHNLFLLYNERLAKYGEVYRGLQTHKGSRGFDTIAIKSIKLSDENRKEVEIIRKLRSHPNVITVLQSGTYFLGPIEHLFIAMEYFKSKTLTDFVNDDPKPKTDEVKHKQIEQFVEAVDHIHINEVLHRDLKPDNILVSDNGRILKIIDFGLGKQLRKGHFVTKMSTLRVGTDGWRAPEIYLSDSCSKQSDIFSSALVIHFISTDGSHPFGNDPDSWNLNIKRYQGCDLSKLEGDLEDLVGWMLRFRPQNRPNTEQIRKHKYFHGQLVCPHPKLSSVVRSSPEKEVVKVREEFEERMKQMELKNEQEKRDAERMRREHEKEMKRMQEEKRKMKIEIEKLKTGKKGAESQSPSQTTSGLRIINQQPPGGMLLWNVLEESLPGYEGWKTLVITYSFHAGSLEGISYEAQELKNEYLPWDDGLICFNLLRQAFNAGLIFKIQEVGDRRGKIVWNDEFPHKTNKTGGPENNGYPDPNHTMKLKKALETKGFEYDGSIW
uniref:CBL-interacting protein kinase 18-like n=1 Tax=Styela clava TaxID=7725 RepID=UPI001939723D|nr:CBL-interacting protein kinase 18-like [Styela clava]